MVKRSYRIEYPGGGGKKKRYEGEDVTSDRVARTTYQPSNWLFIFASVAGITHGHALHNKRINLRQRQQQQRLNRGTRESIVGTPVGVWLIISARTAIRVTAAFNYGVAIVGAIARAPKETGFRRGPDVSARTFVIPAVTSSYRNS